ncbi:cobalamin-binding protein [Pseudalkalibacillus berkeleyi]|uniref:Cobalamin-binding protein n=1 Tax=Pseudalkalibacillus berkeleyi TaxID=1069813 RepID=A0ABS9H374_9BACL|nr:cobalamin-binding protein [Pseudalkalibacillus berkeleyi]MCF6138521.1 cobalamin-binding protein [Pseudalkalibacillus berkeleyi]
MRIISICPSNTELVEYLGLTHCLVGVDDFSDWPKEIESLPKLGPDLDIDMDRLESLQPDLVLASLSVPGMEKNIERLEERGIPYHIFNPNSLKEIGDDLLTLGELTNQTERAERLVTHYRSVIEQYRTISNTVVEKPSLYWEWWPKPVFTPGGVNWLTEISELAGARNAFADENVASVQSDWETVCKREPDHICLVWVGVQTKKVNPKILQKRPNWDRMKAMQLNQVHVLDEPYFCRPSPRLIVGLQKIAAIIHPDKYPAYNEQEDDPLLQKDRL